MSVVRRFLVAPSLVRLLRKERGGSRISEGYFAPQGGRTSFVRIDGQQCHLVLVQPGAEEQRTEVPRAHGDALLDVCVGKALYDRTTVSLAGSGEVMIDRYVAPAGFDLASVAFENDAAAKAFVPPVWLATEVSGDAAYDRQAIALQGPPQAGEIPLTNAALDAVLDLIEPRFGLRPSAPPPRAPAPAPAPAPKPPEPKAAEVKPAETKPAEAKAPEPKPAAPTPAKPPEAAAPEPAKPEPAKPEPEKPAEAPKQAEAAPAAAAAALPAAAAAAKPAEPNGVVDALRQMTERTPEAATREQPEKADEASASDTRIDDVIESLSQALGAAIQQPQEPAREDDLAASFERWTVRPRRTTQQG